MGDAVGLTIVDFGFLNVGLLVKTRERGRRWQGGVGIAVEETGLRVGEGGKNLRAEKLAVKIWDDTHGKPSNPAPAIFRSWAYISDIAHEAETLGQIEETTFHIRVFQYLFGCENGSY